MSYNKKVWKSGDRITKEALNNMENGIEAAHQNSGGTGSVAIVDNLNSDSSTSALSAKQGKELNNKMPAKSIVEGGKIYLAKEDGTKLDSGTELPAGGSTIEVVNNLESDSTTAALSAAQGKILNTQYKDLASKIGSGSISNAIEPQLMDMPRIYFSEGTLPTSKTDTMLKFDYYSKTKEYHGWAEIKCQGTSSMSYPKKNFTIKLYKDKDKAKKLKIDFKGWGAQSKFCLKANWIDITHARNVVSAKIWGDVVKTRNDYTNLPELLRTSPNQGAIDGFPIIVYGNGGYQGRYTLNIPKDKWMSNMDDALDTHGILCGENYASGCFRALPVINGTDWTDELHDVVPATIKTSWTNAIKFVMNSTDAEFKANSSNYFDVNSLIDYLLYGIVSTGLDAFGKNQIYFTYDGIKWIASMYDMDSTWGLWWNGSKFVATDYAREDFQDLKDEGNGVTKQGNLLYLRLQQLFIPQLKTRYAELRKDVLSVSHIIQKFEEFNDVCPKDIVQEDYASTTGEGKFTGIPSKTTNNIQQLRSYINARLTYVDGYINALQEDTPCTNITLNNATLSFTTDAAQTLTATLTPTDTTDKVVWSVSPTGICTVEDGVVTAIKNGTCVITATCGSHSATCNVTVNLPSVACTSIALDKTALQLGTIESSTPDTETNLLEGLSWKDGQLNDNTGIMGTGTDKCIANIPIPATGLYTLSCSVKYTYPKIFLYNNDNQLIRSNIGNNNNNSLSIYVYEPNCHISISLFPNSLEFSENNVTLKYTHNMADTPNKDTDIQASAIANFNLLITSGDYKIIELYADKVYTDIAALKLGSTTYKLYNWNVVSDKNLGANANDAAISITRMNNGYCTKGEWAGKTFFNIAVPSTWGDTKEDIINYIQTNNIAVIMNPSEYLNSADKIGSTTINSYQLKPTIQPNNCTDIVVWSVSPEGIVAVNNGLVKAVSNGETVVTATCGTKSATCNVSVINLKDPNIISPQEFMIPCDNFVAAGGNVTVNDNTIHFTAANRNNYNSYYLRTKAEGTGKDIADGLNITIEAGKKIHLSFNYEVTKKASESINIGYVINKKNENTGEYKISSVGTGQGELNFTVINNSTLNDIYIYPGNPGEYDFSITFNDIEILDA